MRLINADVLKQHIDKLPALPDGNFAGNHSALKALINMQPTIEPSTSCSEFPNNSNVINRQDAIDALDKRFDNIPIEQTAEILMLRRDLRELPTVQPERKQGKWVYGEDEYGIDGYHCDKCGFFVPWDYAHKFINYIEDYNFCPHCGAKMGGDTT